jgi:hypothetical protein
VATNQAPVFGLDSTTLKCIENGGNTSFLRVVQVVSLGSDDEAMQVLHCHMCSNVSILSN